MRHIYSGKVRDVYEVDQERLLLVTSDRISAFDVVMSQPVPGKGRALTALTAFWATELSKVAPSHLIEVGVPAGVDIEAAGVAPSYAEGRTMLVRRAQMLPLECIVRGYLAGSAWAEYKRRGTVHGIAAAGRDCCTPRPCPSPFSPRPPRPPRATTRTSRSTRPSTWWAAPLASAAAEICVEAYRRAAARGRGAGHRHLRHQVRAGLIDGELALCDEVLTPDSSRFWPADDWGRAPTPPSFDKQPLRDWLEAQPLGQASAAPGPPAEIVEATRTRYVAAYELRG